jgi:TRAP-type C4-dicarboxylate transport system permease small subunit
VSHGFEMKPEASIAVPNSSVLAAFVTALNQFNKGALLLSMAALILTSAILTYSVVARYFFHIPTDWQDEASVFMLVGVIFLCAAYVQSHRGHIGIEALASILPSRVNQIRLFLVDLLSLLFCAFFAWKSWSLCHEAWVEGQTTSSTFAPPLWIPYSMMALGMTMLTLQLLAQVLTQINGTREAA